jgi:hypothetical protein
MEYKYRVIDAPGYTGRDNKAAVHGYSRSLDGAKRLARRIGRRAAIQRGSFGRRESWTWADWAHLGGIQAGHLRWEA